MALESRRRGGALLGTAGLAGDGAGQRGVPVAREPVPAHARALASREPGADLPHQPGGELVAAGQDGPQPRARRRPEDLLGRRGLAHALRAQAPRARHDDGARHPHQGPALLPVRTGRRHPRRGLPVQGAAAAGLARLAVHALHRDGARPRVPVAARRPAHRARPRRRRPDRLLRRGRRVHARRTWTCSRRSRRRRRWPPTRPSCSAASTRSPPCSSRASCPTRCPRCPDSRRTACIVPRAGSPRSAATTTTCSRATDGGVVLSIADVCGQGVRAATKTSMIRYSVRGMAAAGLEPAAMVSELNRMVAESGDTSDIVTAFVGVVDRDRRTLTYANAGHPPALVARETRCTALQTTGPLLGAIAGIAFARAHGGARARGPARHVHGRRDRGASRQRALRRGAAASRRRRRAATRPT